MRNAHVRWLQRELPELVRRDLLSEDAAAALRRHYGEPSSTAATSIALVVFSSLGAVLVGGGVILLVAHNWEDLTRPVRAAISIGLLLAAQAVAAFTLVRRSGSAHWREAAGGSVVLAAAASIALISQTYNFGGEIPEYLRTVILLSLPVVYLLDSVLAAALVWIAMTIFVFGFSLSTVHGWWYWIFAAGSLPYLLWLAGRPRRDWRLLAILVAVAGAIAVMTFGALSGQAVVWMIPLAGLFAAYWAVGARAAREGMEGWRRSFLAIGGVGGPILILTLTFDGAWKDLREFEPPPHDPSTAWITLAVGILFGLLAAAQAVSELRASRWHMALPPSLALLVALGWALTLQYGPPPAQILMNLCLMAWGILFIAAGLKDVRLGTINYGLLLVSALALARFFDADISFVTRGIGFIVVGAAFFAVNAFVIARRKGVTA